MRVTDINSNLSVDDIETAKGFYAAYRLPRALGRGLGLRRFFVRAPDGTVINMTSHRVSD